ncbi:MAG: CoA ester lyase [Gammaproteobacteria bacterium]|nr:CoA ester lyase [Gammaproteobacteria bacterium]
MNTTASNIDDAARARRSFIFTPGLRPDMFPKALAGGADMVCVELEDGIAPKDKVEARRKGLALFAGAGGGVESTGDTVKSGGAESTGDIAESNRDVECIVRINSLATAFGLDDVQAVLAASAIDAPPALMLPKVKSPDEIVWLDDLLTERGHACRLHIIIETNEGLEAAHDIAHASARIDALFFGGIDMAAELRCKSAWQPLLYARSRVVHAAASAGVDVIDVPYLDLQDAAGMTREAELARDLGFCGKGAIHPKQIDAINRVFTPDKAAIDKARKVLKAFDEADTGLVVVDGKLIEAPVLREMRRIMAVAERVAER